MPSPRAFTWTVLVILVVTGALHVLGAMVLRDSFWGTHFYAFLPQVVLVVATLLLAASAGLLGRRGAAVVESWNERLPADRLRAPLVIALLAVAGGVVFWLARAGHVILGDGSILVVNIPQGEAFHPREPLTALLQQGLYRLTAGWFAGPGVAERDVAQASLAVGSALAGALFVPVAWGLGRELVRLGGGDHAGQDDARLAPALVAGLLLTQGYAQLFCGYVENYTFVTLAMGLYLWLSLRALRRGSSVLLSGAALVLALLLHLSAAVLVPSFVVLVGRGLLDRTARWRTLRDLALSAVLLVAAGWLLDRTGEGYHLLRTLLDVSFLALLNREENVPGYMLSGVHLRNFLNEQLLIGPLGLFLFLPGAGVVVARWVRARQPATADAAPAGAPIAAPHATALFLLAAGLAYAGASWLAGESNLGYPRNWDLLAPGGLVFTVAGLGLFFGAGTRPRAVLAVLLCAGVISLYHTAPWIAVNTSFDRSFARLKTLPSTDGITEVNVARWYLLRGDRDQARIWLRKCLEANPYNNSAHFLVGMLHLQDDNLDGAADAFLRATKARPDKVEYRLKLTDTLLRAGRYAEAAEQGRILAEDRAAGSGRAGPLRPGPGALRPHRRGLAHARPRPQRPRRQRDKPPRRCPAARLRRHAAGRPAVGGRRHGLRRRRPPHRLAARPGPEPRLRPGPGRPLRGRPARLAARRGQQRSAGAHPDQPRRAAPGHGATGCGAALSGASAGGVADGGAGGACAGVVGGAGVRGGRFGY